MPIPKNLKTFAYGISYTFKTKLLGRKIPFIGGLVVGESCNLDCKHCDVSCRNRENDMSFKEIERGLLDFYKRGIRLLAITGGEPFYWRDENLKLEDIIKLGREIGFTIISVYTNGTHGLETSADDVFVSIDGLKQSCSELRGNVYDLVINNIKKSKHPNIIVNCTINNKNKAEIDDFCEYISKIGNIKGIFFYFHTPYYGIDDLFIGLEDRKKIIKKILNLKKRYRILNSVACLWDAYHNRWSRPSDLCLVYADNRTYTCCRSVGNKTACENCGYLGYPEIINITNLKPSAIMSALSYLPKKQ